MSDEGATSQTCLEGLQARLKELVANEDYAGAAAIKEEMRVAEVTEKKTLVAGSSSRSSQSCLPRRITVARQP